ncbi:extracellular solute-binding protein [Treponema sp. J25]|uniref:ABC transporter substrate-binding protein n=1 Tax=Treponema sp. J25 TaxID=2094121 RepID=UPI001051032B|nr:extracellular solute-binding protein [Treponema sp. J25]TCW61200.1 sugar ABC transporter substrate-binding protein [Treponema sp. J25]
MKKTLSVLVAFLAIAGMLFASGQSQSGQAAGGKQVVVKAMAYGDNSNAEGVNWVRIVKAFEKENPNIKIEYELLYDEAYHQKVVARLAAGDVPHLAYMGADARWGKPWKEANQQFDHRPYIDANYFDLNLIPPMGPNGEIYEIPLGTSNITTVLYMNEELVKSLGFSEPKTYEDLVAMVPKAKAAGLDVVSIDGADGWAWGSCLMSAIIARLSGDANWVSKAVEGKYKFTDQVFVDSLKLLQRMVKDGVISEKSILVDYGANLSNFSNKKALFMIQGQWAAGSIDPAVAEKTKMLAWPKLPGEKPAMAGSVAAAIQVGYGLTQAGAKDPAVRDAALKFLKYFYSYEETTQRLRDGAIVAPILKNYKVPDDLPSIVKQKVVLAQSAKNTDVIDAYLSGAPNDALNAGMQKIVAGTATPEEVAAEVEKLLRGK